MTWKDQIAPNEIFPQKITNKLFMYLLGDWTSYQIFKKGGEAWQGLSF